MNGIFKVSKFSKGETKVIRKCLQNLVEKKCDIPIYDGWLLDITPGQFLEVDTSDPQF